MAAKLNYPTTEQIEKYCAELKEQMIRCRDAGHAVQLVIEPDIQEEGDGFRVLAHRYMGTTHTIRMGRPALDEG